MPEGWEWCRVRDIAAVKGGKRLPKGVGFSPCRTAHAYIRVTDMKNHSINTDDLKYISEEVFLQIKNYTISKDDLYVTIAGTIGVTGEVPTELDGMNLTENAVKITNIQINKTYLCLIIQSEFVQQQFQDKTHQVAMPKLALERILSTLIPVCTITTQSAMVSKFVEMDSLINQIREEKEILAETVSLTKSKILDLAIRGQLVPQDPNDEPASVLLERIRAEKEELIKAGKIKRDKKESIIFRGEDNSYYEKIGNEVHCIDEDIPFKIPHNWIWCRMSSISDIIMGTSPKGTSICENPQYTEFHQGKIHFSDMLIKNSGQYTRALTKIAKPNSILLCVRAPVGEVNLTDRKICIGRGLASISPLGAVSKYFMLYWIKAFRETLIKKATGTTFVAVTTDVVKGLLLPIPPLAEQYRITNKIQSLVENLIYIEKSLR